MQPPFRVLVRPAITRIGSEWRKPLDQKRHLADGAARTNMRCGYDRHRPKRATCGQTSVEQIPDFDGIMIQITWGIPMKWNHAKISFCRCRHKESLPATLKSPRTRKLAWLIPGPDPMIDEYCATLTTCMHACMYRDGQNSLYVVARSLFLLFLNCSAWPCLGPA